MRPYPLWLLAAALIGGIIAVGELAKALLPRHREPQAQSLEQPKDWARVEKTKRLSAAEELSLVIIRSETGEAFDTRCLVYKNTDTGQALFVCPDSSPLSAPSSDWDEPSTPRRSP